MGSMASARLRHPGVRFFFPLRHQCQRKNNCRPTAVLRVLFPATTAPKVILVSQEGMVRVKGQPPRVRCAVRKNSRSPRRQQPRSMITAAVSRGIAPEPVPGVGREVLRSRRADGRRYLCPRPPSHRRRRGYTIIPTPCPSCLRDHRNCAVGPGHVTIATAAAAAREQRCRADAPAALRNGSSAVGVRMKDTDSRLEGCAFSGGGAAAPTASSRAGAAATIVVASRARHRSSATSPTSLNGGQGDADLVDRHP
ncbi:unnamed protein product [Ectocarpus sp. 4 AP-2014]